MELTPYLNFNGDCREAFEFYATCLGGTIVMMQTHGESPMKDQTPPGWQDKILHVRMTVGKATLMGSDAPPQYAAKPQGFAVSLTVEKPEDADRIFAQLAENGNVKMPIQETFWASRFGMVDDRFGTPWMVNCQAAPK
jgi:PhnB protein